MRADRVRPVVSRLLGVVLTVSLLVPAATGAEGAPAGGTFFDAEPASAPVYGIQPPSEDPGRQRTVLEAADGTDLFVETWLPAPNGDAVPPERVPVVVSISPYLAEGQVESGWALRELVPRGYAYANVHVRGTGESGGCIDLFGAVEADDSSLAIEYLGRDAPFSDGNVGGYGISYPGGTILSVAGRGDPERTEHLKAVVSGAPYHSAHEAQWTFDGVPSFLIPAAMPGSYFLVSMGLGDPMAPEAPRHVTERPWCQPDHARAAVDWSGNHTPWHAERDNRAWTADIEAATLMFHGHADLTPQGGSPPSIQRGLFDAIPETTPKAGVFGVFGHTRPANEHPEIDDMIVAWFDRWLRGADTDTDSWPTVQVQGTDGRWRTEAEWPTTGGPVAQLALSPGGALGAEEPDGSTVYVEGWYETTAGFAPGASAVFETAPLPGRLELTGQPVLDLWVTLAAPDAHVAARLEVLDADGEPVPDGHTYGLRSAQHLEAFEDGRFVQSEPVLAPVAEPLRVPVRFQPTNLVVPEGGRLRLTVAGSIIVNPGLSQLGIPEPVFHGPSQASGVVAPVTIHHECVHPSALRFLLPSDSSRTLELAGDSPPAFAGPPPETDGGGTATAPVCGEGPERVPELGPAR